MASLLVSQSAVYQSALESFPMLLVFSRDYSRPVTTEKRLKGQRMDFTLFQSVTLSELRSSCLACGLSVRTQITLSGAWTLCHCQYSDHPVRCLDSVTVSIQIILSGAWTLLLSELRSSCQVPGLCYCQNSDHPVRCLDPVSYTHLRAHETA